MSQLFRELFLSSILAVALLVVVASLSASHAFAQPGASEIRGRLLDGAASSGNIRPEVLRDPAAKWQIPLAAQKVEFRALGGSNGSWVVESDGDGRFTFDPVASGVPDDVTCAAFAEVGGRRLYSPSFDPRAADPRIFLYPVGADPTGVQTVTTVVHTIEKRKSPNSEMQRWLKVAIRVELWNWGRDLFIGAKKAGGREILRVPLPPGARVEKNTGFVEGTRGRYSPDGRFLIWDEPVPGLADLVEGRRAGVSRSVWDIEYLVRPTPLYTLEYPLDLAPAERQRGVELGGFRVYAVHDDMKISDTEVGDQQRGEDGPRSSMKIDATHLELAREVTEHPLDGTSAHLDVYVPRGPSLVAADGLRRPVLVPVQISDSARGAISRKALFWHGGTVFIGITAIFLGLLFGRKRLPAEAVLDGLTSEQILDRIADLDERHERREISDSDYRRYRESLVTIAAEEISGESERPEGPVINPVVEATSARGPSLGERTYEVLREIDELDQADLPSGELVRRRAHLLEALYKSTRKDLSIRQTTGEDLET